MEQHIWYCNKNVTYELIIDNEKDRYNGEGVLQSVVLYRIDKHIIFPKEEVYETTYGYFAALDYFNNLTYDQWDEENGNFDDFKIWIITSLTPITEQRKVKINKIKLKLNEYIKSF
jgi:hypothetical protein